MEQTVAANAQAAMAEAQLNEFIRPIVLVDETQLEGKRFHEVFFVPLKNVGNGTAIKVTYRCQIGLGQDMFSVFGEDVIGNKDALTPIPPGCSTLRFKPAEVISRRLHVSTLEILYRDVRDKAYVTCIHIVALSDRDRFHLSYAPGINA